MSFVKYRVKEVAADFGVTPKDIAEIVGKYFVFFGYTALIG